MTPEVILVIDDERSLRELLRILFQREGYEVLTAASGEEGLELFATHSPALVLTDLTMPGIDGLEVLRQIKARRDVPVIVVTAYGALDTAVQAMKDGAFDYVTKPFQNDEIRLTVRKALTMRRLEADNARMRVELGERFQLGQLVGTSSRMQDVYELVRRIAPTRIGCYIAGESGTGKELVARAVHQGSERVNGPFIAVNCGAIPENLFESELFGSKKGSYTGSVRDKPGLLVSADGGTLFLDEVGEMPLSSQVKVLRALAERRVTPVGGVGEVSFDVRVIAATNRDLRVEVKEGRFREDLYYRLNVVQIDMPPLRERAGDVPQLVHHFLKRFAAEYGKPLQGVDAEVMSLLSAYPFPGNVRELQNIIERAVALERSTLLTTSSLPERVVGPIGSPTERPSDVDLVAGAIDLEARLNTIERDYLERALAATAGNRTKAAALLGISFRSMRHRLQKFGMGEE